MLTPKTEADLAQIIADTDTPLRIQGGGTRPIGAVAGGTQLSTSGLTGITLYEPGALTLVARAGTPLAEIEQTLDAQGQRLAFEPMDHRGLLGTTGTPTIGGVIAANVSGPRRIQVGAARDHLLGVRFVDGSGHILKNGGRVMKNVTGYDLVKLMAGSYGTLGVLSEVSLKVLPKPDTSATFVWSGLGWAAASKVFCDALGSPYEVNGAARLPRKDGEPKTYPTTVIRIEGFEKSVQYRVERLTELFSKMAPDRVVTDPEENATIWQFVRDVKLFAGKSGSVWKTSVKPTDMISVVGGNEFEHCVDWGGGLIWTLTPQSVDLRTKLCNITGHTTLIRSGEGYDNARPTFQPLSPAVAMLHSGLRQKFDPRQILNPGLMGPAA